ncbi:hypothetical protein IKQ21_05800 [bacterium]|nr:hypothetical protein [bacterium]
MCKCDLCKKRFIRLFIVSLYGIKIADIAANVNVSEALVYKHIEGKRNYTPIDEYLFSFLFKNANEVES